MKKIHKEGYRIIITSALLLIILNALILFASSTCGAISITVPLASLLMLAFILRFFRKPSRKFVHEDRKVYSPADGTIVAIEEVEEPEYFNDKRLLVSVFMSVWNVHINWYPFNGKVKYMKYHPGKYLLARHPKSSELNERTSLVLENNNGKEILLRQIAGYVARRVIFYSKEGQNVKAGNEMGFIKFGSRVDVFLPLDSEIRVKLGDKVIGCISEIAILR